MIRPIVFGKFCLLERISVGGMAEVYRAKLLNAPHFNRFLAIKRILPNLAADKEFISMFIDEAKITVELNHPNICQIYELGRLEDSHYIVMEYIPGRDLLAMQNRYRRQKKIMSVSQACFITAQLGQGLDAAHRAVDSQGRPLRVIHRDVSPQNILVSYEGLIKLIDFGVAKAASKNSKTQAGVLKGKFGYMSPEQVEGDRVVDHRSDIFALGTVFWELLTGRRLFHADNEFATLELVRECNVRPPSSLNRLVPPEVEAIVMKALNPDPDLRYQWAGELVRDLWTFLNSCNPPYTQWHLQNWMCTNFAEDLQKEWEKLPVFQTINTIDDVRGYNAAQLAKAEAQMQAQLAPVRDFEGNIVPELEDVEDFGGPSTQVFTPEFDFASVDSEVVEETNPGVPSNMAPQTIETSPPMELQAQHQVQQQQQQQQPPSPAPPVPEKRPAPSRLPEVGFQPPAGREQDFQPGAHPLHESVYAMEVVDFRMIKARRRRNTLLFTLLGVILLGGIGFGVWVMLQSGEATEQEAPPEVATATVYVSPIHEGVLVMIRDGAGSVIAAPGTANFQAVAAGQYLVKDLTPGTYFFEVEHPEFEPEKREVSLGAGGSDVRIEMRTPKPKTGAVIVDLPFDDALIYVEGELQEGAGPQRALDLPEGVEVEVMVKKPGYHPFVTSMTPSSEQAIQIEAELEPGVGTITIRSAPTGVVYFKVGEEWKKKGNTPQSFDKLDATKIYEVEVRKDGYKIWHKAIDFDDQFEKSYLATLTKE